MDDHAPGRQIPMTSWRFPPQPIRPPPPGSREPRMPKYGACLPRPKSRRKPRRTAAPRGYLAVGGASQQSGMAYWMVACSVYLYIAILGANIRICRDEGAARLRERARRGPAAGGAGPVGRGRRAARWSCWQCFPASGCTRAAGSVKVRKMSRISPAAPGGCGSARPLVAAGRRGACPGVSAGQVGGAALPPRRGRPGRSPRRRPGTARPRRSRAATAS